MFDDFSDKDLDDETSSKIEADLEKVRDDIERIQDRRSKIFMVWVIVIFSMLLVCLALLVHGSDVKYDQYKAKLPYYDSTYLEFPPGTKDWKFSHNNYGTEYYCLINDQWHPCYAKEVEATNEPVVNGDK